VVGSSGKCEMCTLGENISEMNFETSSGGSLKRVTTNIFLKIVTCWKLEAMMHFDNVKMHHVAERAQDA
jgi:hypothetical protein